MIWQAVVGSIIIVLVTIWFGRKLDRKLVPSPEELAPKPVFAHAVGEAPATALRVGDVQLAKLRTTQRCPQCRAEMTYADEIDDRVRYDRRDLLLLHFACDRCAGKRTLYVEHRT